MITKKYILVNEICFKCNLEKYRDVIKDIVDKIVDSGIILSCSDVNNSSIQYDLEHLSKPIIRIGVLVTKKHPIHFIWDILHEYGHFISGLKSNKNIDINREIIAWENAYNLILNYSELLTEKADFINYKQDCLDTYLK